ncbi:haloacid dehalogenase type II [Marinococcus halophilus]|uniref:haloacid dehalogenase type II n=1 Tax=Marinococcus halophilus TaxID=1371 RepID=UPI0009A77977|nr:haloacid dehalogenase type II [Marinococcus halophilus]
MSANSIFAFDVYGTLFNIQSVDATCEKYFPGHGESIGQLWRQKQIQYSFLRQAMGKYVPFSSVTRDALRFSLAAHHLEWTADTEQTLMEAYNHLSLYEESLHVLQKLKDQSSTLIVFSNGSRDMLEPLLEQSGLNDYLDHVISVDDIKQFKPSPASYQLILETVGAPRHEVTFLSSNGWDISGAKAFGFTTAWINRSEQPIEELQLPPDYQYTTLAPLTQD